MKTLLLIAAMAVSVSAEVRLPKYTRAELPNGVVVIAIPKSGIPLVQLRVLVKGGSDADPVTQNGLSGVAANLLRKGGKSHSADAFSNELDSLGGTFNAINNDETTIIAAEFLKKDFAQGLGLLSDAVLNPTFPEEEVKKLLSQSIDRVRAIKDNPAAAINSYFRPFFYGLTHPYGHIADEETYGRIDRSSIAAFHKKQYVGRNMIVLVSGDFDTAIATPAIAKIFGAIPAGTAYKFQPEAKPLSGGRLLLIDKPDATQTYFEIAQPGIRHTDQDRTGVELLNTLFGGRFTSLLNDALRVGSGLTYGARSTVSQPRNPGAVSISTYTRTETTEKAMDMALDVLKKFHDKGIDAAQLASAKAYVKGLFPTQKLETSDQVATVVGEMELYGLNKGEVDDLFSRIDAVTLDEANAMAKKHYALDNLTFVVLGNAGKIRDSVKKYAPIVTEVEIKTPGFSTK